MNFELLVAIRYLKAKRKKAAISVITAISIVSVAAGVAALVVALAMNAGLHADLQAKLLSAQPHISLLPKDPAGIPDYLNLTKQVEQMDSVVAAAPAVYQTVLVSGTRADKPVEMKGMIPESEARMSGLAKNIVKGDMKNFNDDGIVIGRDLAESLGVEIGDNVDVTSAAKTISPGGSVPRHHIFILVATFSSGLYDLDNSWIYVPLYQSQRLIGLGPDAVTSIDVKVRAEDLDRAPEIAKNLVDKLGSYHLEKTDWVELNKSTFQAMKLERLGMIIAIGLIVLVASLNIVGMLIMMVLEKTRDIAILLSMGATSRQIRKIFIWQGVIIGVLGTIGGVVLGQLISFLGDKYHLIPLNAEIYAIAYIPFRANVWDSVIIAASAILISFLATLYPSAAAAKLHPVESLRYE